ncbi:SIS domain-containing protein [Sneathiella sp. P13V-1]|uniref:MurR/RpiR family transcriptional regulator n=1 Tax=Sneathiella sp. P13V-1 TaxID=2697366 RepID=UPI00187B5C4F|nr:MurR/RpiR family transcriptional regulator [Sneathiella sp. P13V-1]MBE7638519.1 SIS domain-containing protein [Sneathiella sp. P13V-1]
MERRQGSDILREIEGRYGGLSPQLQMGARFILDSPRDVAVYSMREIAARADVKPSTMVRLANKLGFDNYVELRDEFRRRYSEQSSGYAARARRLQLRNVGDEDSLIADMMGAEVSNIQNTLSGFDDTDLEAAARNFLNARRVHVVGLRKCYPIAHFFKYATRVFFKDCRLIQGNAGMFPEEMEQIGRDDILLAAAFDPYTRETVEAVRYAQKVGAKTVVITDNTVSPLAAGATHLFVAANASPSFYRSLSGALIIVQALVAAIVTALGEPAVEALEQSDKGLRRNNTYWNG